MKKNILFLLAAFCMVLTACQGTGTGASSQAAEKTVYAMDTVMNLTVYGDESLLDDAEDLIYSLEKKLSATDEESEIAAVNRDKTATLSEDTAQLLDTALALCERTDGLLDISIYPVVKAWGFPTGEYRVPEEEELNELLSAVSWEDISLSGDTVTVGEDMELDLGGVAKGYTGDRLLSMLSENGVESALINLGGNVQALGTKPDGSAWRIAVTDPEEDGYLGILSITDQAVITSGGYERYFEQDGKRYHHILDPRTGYPAENGFSSVTIVGDSGVLCDAYSTALYVMGPEKAFAFWKEQQNFDAVFLTDDGTLYITEGLADSFTPQGRFASAEPEVLYAE